MLYTELKYLYKTLSENKNTIDSKRQQLWWIKSQRENNLGRVLKTGSESI